ncbi:MAG: UDP-N-acetylmuramoyl-L-alanine--D-glutamate ligase [Oscillospiraceae bacterium]|nr:UDP-N-acetylmuramoyl-L-alanine--D-glutamate ligase [Oscillospiraceae bacterium]
MDFEEYFAALRGKKIAVIGLGISNRPLLRLLEERGLDVTVRDKKDGEDYLAGLTEDVIFRTPGLMPHTPQLAAAVARGSVLTSEMEAFFEVCPCKIIAVTGSDGKTTTTSIIAELLRGEGKTVHVGGNIGTPLLDRVPDMRAEDFAALELSSFQLITMKRSPDIAVITNVAPNHLDIHRDFAEYVDAKKNIFAHQSKDGVLVLDYDDEICRKFAAEAVGEVRFFNEETIDFEIRIPGAHNVLNYKAAIAATRGLVSDDTIRRVAREFNGVEHRIELVRELRGVKYYNDSIASSPSRTIAGLRSFSQKVRLIAGGKDKGVPFDSLGPEIIERVKTLVLTGYTAEKIRDVVVNCEGFSGSPDIVIEPDFERAVLAARDAASAGDIVLLSPACTSFDRFKNFEERGNVFKELVKGLE